MGIGLRIKQLREEKKMTQKKASNLIVIDKSSYSKMERDLLTPTIKQVIELSSIFNRSIDWILKGEEYILLPKDNTTSTQEHIKFLHQQIKVQNNLIKDLSNIIKKTSSQNTSSLLIRNGINPKL